MPSSVSLPSFVSATTGFPSLRLLQLDVAVFLGTFALSAGLTALTVKICGQQGWVARPRPDRWHRTTPSLFGGVPIWLTAIGLSVAILPFGDWLLWKLLAASSFIFLLGVADDILHLGPSTKLAGQILAASWLAASGVIYPLQSNVTVNFLVSVVWIVGITNAFNLLDNMDGLTAGVALVSAAYLAIFYAGDGSRDYNLLAVIASAAAAGFLLFNFNRARIFMGDCGSLFLGFLVGALSLLKVTHVSGVPALVLTPAVVLAVPIFDTLFVSAARQLRGQALSQGGTDHSSHRLVQLGLNERSAVALLLGLSVMSGAVALVARHLFYTHAIGLIGFWFFILLLFGVYLFRPETMVRTETMVDAETTAPDAATHRVSHGLRRHILARDALACLLDPIALSLSYYLAYFLRFRISVPSADLELFFRTWPMVVALKFAGLWACRVYQRSWWRGSIEDAYRLAKAALAGEAAVVLILIAIDRFAGFSRMVFGLDAIFSWVLLQTVRRSFPFFRSSLDWWMGNNANPGQAEARRVFLLGTSEHVPPALRYLRSQRIACAGLIDINGDTNGGADLGHWVWGTPVLGRIEDLSRLAHQHGVSEIVLPVDELLPYPEVELGAHCARAYVRLFKLGLHPLEAGAELVIEVDEEMEKEAEKAETR